MKVHEFLADLRNRLHQNAQVLVVESDAPDNAFAVESVARGDNEKAVLFC
jgi:hypothetical protein